MSLLYIGTFGSFIGFGFAFGQVLQMQFADSFDTPVNAAYLTFLGPLLGSLVRPVGGSLADRFGGPGSPSGTSSPMAARRRGRLRRPRRLGSLPLFVVGFVALFVAQRHRQRLDLQDDPGDLPRAGAADGRRRRGRRGADRTARRMSGALIGIAGAIGAFGGVLVNLAFRQSFLTTGTGDAAYRGVHRLLRSSASP